MAEGLGAHAERVTQDRKISPPPCSRPVTVAARRWIALSTGPRANLDPHHLTKLRDAARKKAGADLALKKPSLKNDEMTTRP